MSERVNLDEVPTGNNKPTSVEFPLPSLRHFLTPDQTVSLKTFSAKTVEDLDSQINAWVNSTCNIITIPGPVSVIQDGEKAFLLSVTFIRAVK